LSFFGLFLFGFPFLLFLVFLRFSFVLLLFFFVFGLFVCFFALFGVFVLFCFSFVLFCFVLWCFLGFFFSENYKLMSTMRLRTQHTKTNPQGNSKQKNLNRKRLKQPKAGASINNLLLTTTIETYVRG